MEESGTKGVSLPDDLAIEILVHLPVRSLMRFKCVSKSWLNLIKDPSSSFINKHYAIQSKKNGNNLLLMRRYFKDDVLSFHDLELNVVQPNLSIPLLDSIKCDISILEMYECILGPCKGLVCIIASSDILIGEHIILCNPALREFKYLPPSPFKTLFDEHDADTIGEGFGNSKNDFKVVLIRDVMYVENNELYEFLGDEYENEDGKPVNFTIVHLYNSSTNSWRQIDSHGTVHPSFMAKVGVFFKGRIHWHAYIDYTYRLNCVILCFDMNMEVFKELEYPECLTKCYPGLRYPTVLNDFLALIDFKHGPDVKELCHIDVWVMMDYGVKSSWVKQFEIRQEEVLLFPLCWKSDGYLSTVHYFYRGLACVELQKKEEINKPQVYWKPQNSRVSIYEESLLSLNQVIKS